MKSDLAYSSLSPLQAPHRFRLGVTSYVYPADIIPNVEALAPAVDDIELVLFESEDVSNLPTLETVARLSELAEEHDLTYTVHLPIDRKLGSDSGAERLIMQKNIIRIIRLSQTLSPYAYVLHIEGIDSRAHSWRIRNWQRDVTGLLPEIVAQADDPAMICVENLNYPFEWCEQFLESFGLSVCIDVGHFWLNGTNISPHIQRYLDRTRVIHLHGLRDGRDHLSLGTLPLEKLRYLMNILDDYTGVLTLEMFSFEDVRDSIERISQCLEN